MRIAAQFLGHEHQYADRGDFGVADGVASVKVVTAALEKRGQVASRNLRGGPQRAPRALFS